ncbi:MAG: hypothetical protein LBS51_08125 [Oscillospiraceae bacterium]|nr:hypothetical protein [Oscillospiraceae bacterium]
MIDQYQIVKLKSGQKACIVEILEQGRAYIADIEISEGNFETEQISQDDIACVYVEVEIPLSKTV